jgi:hypothetical protein
MGHQRRQPDAPGLMADIKEMVAKPRAVSK